MFLCPWGFLGKNTGVSCRFLLQGIFPTQGLNADLPPLQADTLPSKPPGKPRMRWILLWWRVYCCSVAQSCLTLCDPVGASPPGSSVHGAFQARILEWVAISFSRGSSHSRDQPVSPAWQADSLPLSHKKGITVTTNNVPAEHLQHLKDPCPLAYIRCIMFSHITLWDQQHEKKWQYPHFWHQGINRLWYLS